MMLARFASNIFWLGRYLERAESIARMIKINETTLDSRTGQAETNKLLKLYDETERFLESHDEVSAETVLTYYTIDQDNPNAIVSCIAAARENARSLRHILSTEMWTELNIFHGRTQALGGRDIRPANRAIFIDTIVLGCQSIEGIAEGTFMRGEPWCFYQLGKYIERADQTTRALDTNYLDLVPEDGDALASLKWHVVLRALSAYQAYRRRYPGIIAHRSIASFLLYDERFPRSVRHCLECVETRLSDLNELHESKGRAAITDRLHRLSHALETGPSKRMSASGLHKFIDRVQAELATLSNTVADTYFMAD